MFEISFSFRWVVQFFRKMRHYRWIVETLNNQLQLKFNRIYLKNKIFNIFVLINGMFFFENLLCELSRVSDLNFVSAHSKRTGFSAIQHTIIPNWIDSFDPARCTVSNCFFFYIYQETDEKNKTTTKKTRRSWTSCCAPRFANRSSICPSSSPKFIRS